MSSQARRCKHHSWAQPGCSSMVPNTPRTQPQQLPRQHRTVQQGRHATWLFDSLSKVKRNWKQNWSSEYHQTSAVVPQPGPALRCTVHTEDEKRDRRRQKAGGRHQRYSNGRTHGSPMRHLHAAPYNLYTGYNRWWWTGSYHKYGFVRSLGSPPSARRPISCVTRSATTRHRTLSWKTECTQDYGD